MKLWWLKLLLVGTFVFWASGTAKYAHEQIEHHGKDMSVADDDDDDDSSVAPQAPAPTQDTSNSAKPHPHQPCIVCQMLAAMTADRSSPPALPNALSGCIAMLAVAHWQAPALRWHFQLPARGPPAAISCL